MWSHNDGKTRQQHPSEVGLKFVVLLWWLGSNESLASARTNVHEHCRDDACVT